VSCMHVYLSCVVYVGMYVCRVCARVWFTRDDDDFLRRAYFFRRTKGRERPRREESRDIVNRNTYILFIVYLLRRHACTEINKFIDKKNFHPIDSWDIKIIFCQNPNICVCIDSFIWKTVANIYGKSVIDFFTSR